MGKRHKNLGKKARVTEIVDGDTLKVTMKGSGQTIRIACIDAPEMEQAPFGQQAKDVLTGLMKVGVKVYLDIKDTDRYGRLVSEVKSKKGFNYGLAMVRSGYSFVYEEYASQCDDKLLMKAEVASQADSAGLWSIPDLIKPWDYRNSNDGFQADSPEEAGEDESDFQIPLYSGSRVITCGEISSREEADSWLAAGHAYLDADGDGCACESQFPC